MGASYRHSDVEIVYFDIETSGFKRTDDILQISMASENDLFNSYAKPTKDISPAATSVHGLTRNRSNLYLYGRKVKAPPLRSVLIELLKFLRGLGDRCVLVAHNCGFDSSRLLLKIKHFSLIDEFRKVIVGFTDTLCLFKERFPHRRGRGAFKLTSLAKDLLHLPPKEVHARAHNATHDVEMLEKLSLKFFSSNTIVKSAKTYDHLVDRMERKEESLYYLQSLEPLKGVISKYMLERMAYATIHYDTIVSEYQKSEQHAINLLERRFNGKPQVIKSKRILYDILRYLREYFNGF